MKTFKNYMVIDVTNEDWCLAEFQDYEKAKDFIKAVVLKDSEQLEIWGTDEDPDTYTSCRTVYIRNLKKGVAVDIAKLEEKNPDILNLAYKLFDEEGEESVEELVVDLSTVSGCHDIIKFLLDTIESILN